MSNKPVALFERPSFLAGVTFLSGFFNGYTSITRGGILPNNQTGNMSKLGMAIAQCNWASIPKFAVPILLTVLGAIVGELMRVNCPKGKDWRQRTMTLQLVILGIVMFLPHSVPDMWVASLMTFVAGIYTCMFKSCQWGAHNSTVCTGNLRSIGFYLFSAINEKSADAITRVLQYSGVVFCYVLGSGAAVPVCNALDTYGMILGMIVLAALLFVLHTHEKKAAAAN